jgi:beta-glucanase (GH16 family)
MKFFKAIIFVFIISCTYYVNAQSLPGWKLVWSDEFTGTTIDKSKWSHEVDCWGGGNNELQCYTARSQNSYVANGYLNIAAKPGRYTGTISDCTNNNDNSCGNTKDYTSARMNTKASASWKYGRFEMRAKLPKGNFLWPAFWMLPTDNVYGAWAASGEIDIMENRGQEPNSVASTLHHGGQWPNNRYTTSGLKTYPFDFTEDFHTFAVEWEEKEMRFYTDTTLDHVLDLNRSWYSGVGPNPYTKNGQPWDQRMFILLNMAIGGGFFPQSMGSLSPQTAAAWANPVYMIDYIRVYQVDNTNSTSSTSSTSSSSSSATSSSATSSSSSSSSSSTSSSTSSTSSDGTSVSATSSSSNTPVTDNGGNVNENQDNVTPTNTITNGFSNMANISNFLIGAVVAVLLLLVVTVALMIFITMRALRWMRDNEPITAVSMGRA